MCDEDLIFSVEKKMKKCIDSLSSEYATMRVGRANPAVLNKVKVDYYGTPTSVAQLAAVSVAEARVLVINPWDVSTLKLIEKAIQQSDIGINPTSDGKVIRLIFPQLTRERRQEIVKEIGTIKENFKVSIRNLRREAIDELKLMKKDGSFGEDELKIKEKNVQNLVDRFVKKIDEISSAKEKEILEI